MASGEIGESPIGIFDSGYGGLTILKEIRKRLPQYDYIYLGDNARAPYGTRSYDIVYQFTLQAVNYLFEQGCKLIILACNTASAKALRTIQQIDLVKRDSSLRVLGIIRPTVEVVDRYTTSGVIGIFGTPGTITSKSYDIEISKLFPSYRTVGHSCPMWVPLIENNVFTSSGAQYFIEHDVQALVEKAPGMDAVILGCTHYPIIKEDIKRYLPEGIKIIEQGPIVGYSLKDYLERHPEMEERCSKGGKITYLTTEDSSRFNTLAARFTGQKIESLNITLI